MLITFYTNVSVVGKMRIKLFGAGYFLSNYIFQAVNRVRNPDLTFQNVNIRVNIGVITK